MANRPFRQPELLVLATLVALTACLEPYELDCDEPEATPASVADTPELADLGVPVEQFIEDLEEVRMGRLMSGDIRGGLAGGQPMLDEPISVKVELEYQRDGQLITPDGDSCGPPYLELPVRLTIEHGEETLLTATGDGPIGWQQDGFPRAEMEAVFAPALWELLGLDPPAEEQPLASMFVFYRESLAESVHIDLRYCDRSNPGCSSDFAHIVWER